jgi:hypothetical protein
MAKKKIRVPKLKKKNRTPDPDSPAYAMRWREHLAQENEAAETGAAGEGEEKRAQDDDPE